MTKERAKKNNQRYTGSPRLPSFNRKFLAGNENLPSTTSKITPQNKKKKKKIIYTLLGSEVSRFWASQSLCFVLRALEKNNHLSRTASSPRTSSIRDVDACPLNRRPSSVCRLLGGKSLLAYYVVNLSEDGVKRVLNVEGFQRRRLQEGEPLLLG